MSDSSDDELMRKGLTMSDLKNFRKRNLVINQNNRVIPHLRFLHPPMCTEELCVRSRNVHLFILLQTVVLFDGIKVVLFKAK
jgi:hypothetical protein